MEKVWFKMNDIFRLTYIGVKMWTFLVSTGNLC